MYPGNHHLRDASTLLATDYGRNLTFKYEQCWCTLLESIQNPEPATRLFALRCIGRVPSRTLTSFNLLQKLVKQLCSLTSGDELWTIRVTAALILGRTIPAMCASQNSSSLLQMSFNSVLSQFLSVFPADLGDALLADPDKFSSSNFLSTRMVNSRIILIHAMAYFFPHPVSWTVEVIHYIDTLYAALLKPMVHPNLQSAVLHAIRANIPLTNQNRLRIETIFCPAVTDIIWKTTSEKSHESELTLESRAQTVHKQLTLEFGRFFNVWYLRPKDSQLLCMTSSPEQTLHINDGYIHRRYKQLSELRKTFVQLPILDQVNMTLSKLVSYCNSCLGVKEAVLHKNRFKYVTPKQKSLSQTVLEERRTPNNTMMPSKDFDIINHTVLSFSNSSPIVFSNGPFVRDLFINNRSTHDIHFTIQVSPAFFFQVTPGVGFIPKGGSFAISVKFLPSPYIWKSTNEVTGFARLRTIEGVPMDRIALKGYNMPYLKVLPSNINLRCCLSGEQVYTLKVQNLLPVDCHCVLSLVSSPTSMCFQLQNSQIFLKPNEYRYIQVKFTPVLVLSGTKIRDKLIVVGFGSEVHTIELTGSIEEPLKVFDTKLDMGPLDILYGPVTKMIRLKNSDLTEQLPVLCTVTSNEIIVNHGSELILLPGEIRKVPVSFLSHYTGARQEFLHLSAPGSITYTIEILATSGPAVLVPVMDEIFFPSSRSGAGSIIYLPLTNVTNSPVQFSITVPKNTPFFLTLLEYEYCNHKPSGNNAVVPVIDSKNHEADDSNGLMIMLPGRVTATVAIEAKSIAAGCFRANLQINMMKPRKILIANQYLNAFFLTEKPTMNENPTELLRAFAKNLGRHSNLVKTPQLKKPVTSEQLTGFKQDISEKSSGIFELDPPTLMVSGLYLAKHIKAATCVEIVTLYNISSKRQTYHIVLSHYFITNVPLHGELEAGNSIEIPVILNKNIAPKYLARNDIGKIALGSLTVLGDESNRYALASCALQGITSETLVTLEIRSSVDSLKFPMSKINGRESRRIFVRNHSAHNIIFEAKINRKYDQGALSHSGEFPFSVQQQRLTLKPFELYSLDIFFLATAQAHYRSCLEIEYSDPISHILDGAVISSKARRQISSLYVECSVSVPDISLSNDVLSFEDIPVLESGSQAFTIMNNSLVDIICLISSCSPYFVCNFSSKKSNNVKENGYSKDSEALFTKLNQSSKSEVILHFNPMKAGYFSNLLYVHTPEITKSLTLLGCCSNTQLIGDLAKPQILLRSANTDNSSFSQVYPGSVINFGFIQLGKSTSKMLTLQNVGTNDFVIKSIMSHIPKPAHNSENDNGASVNIYLKWKLHEDLSNIKCSYAGFPRKYQEENIETQDMTTCSSDAIEIDWDEVDFQRRDEKNLRGNVDINVKEQSGREVRDVNIKRKKTKVMIARTPSLGNAGNILRNDQFLESPILLPPLERLELILTFGGTEKGEYSSFLKIEQERAGFETDTYQLCVTANFQPTLQLKDKKLEFGVCAAHNHHVGQVQFVNTGSTALNWKIDQEAIQYVPIHGISSISVPEPSTLNHALWIPSPFSIYPSFGNLPPGHTQVVDVTFTPNLAECEVSALLALHTEDFATNTIKVHGIGATCKLISNESHLDFGILRVGTKKTFSLQLRNSGILQLRYFIEIHNFNMNKFVGVNPASCFSVNPEQGVLDGGGNICVKIRFNALSAGKVNAYLHIMSKSAEKDILEPAIVQLTGVGSYPELNVLTKTVDFGTALFMNANKKFVAVQNLGLAEECPVNKEENRGENKLSISEADNPISILPNETKNIPIVYTPKILENLNTKAYIRSSDARGDFFVINLKGSVGMPKLSIYPENILDDLDFGVCSISGTYKKMFSLKNEGNISLTYSLSLVLEQEKINEKNTEPASGTLAVGNTVAVTLHFIPPYLAEFLYKLTLSYEFKTLTTKVKGIGGCAILKIENPLRLVDFGTCRMSSTSERILTIHNSGNLDLGVNPIHGETTKVFFLKNCGAFGIDFLVEPTGMKEFVLSPLRGYIEPECFMCINLLFCPTSENKFQSKIKILWEDDPLIILVQGSGGVGKLTVLYSNSVDAAAKGLEFGMVPFNLPIEKFFSITNTGMVEVSSKISIDSNDFALVQLGEPEMLGGTTKPANLTIGHGTTNFNLKQSKKYPKVWTQLLNTVFPANSVVNIDPRSGWARMQLFKEKSIQGEEQKHYKLRAKDYWKLIQHMICKVDRFEDSAQITGKMSHLWSSSLAKPTIGDHTGHLHNSTIREVTSTTKLSDNLASTTQISQLSTSSVTPTGEIETMTRNFTNVGHKDVNFQISNTNSSLTISPSKGFLPIGQSILVQFMFCPIDETIQSSDIFFEPDCSQPIRLKFNGGGGFAKASLAKYRRFDFGHCMIGKDTVSFLPIVNEGNAFLHLTRFDLFETDTFFKGLNWPEGRVSLFPGASFNLPIVFNPHQESPLPGKLIVGTNINNYEIELVGAGREAVLIVSKVALEFSECLIGNSYEQKLGLKNVGDVNYPVTFKLDSEFPDLEFLPPALVISPFSEIKEEIDFGMFERTSRPSITLTIRNTGTIQTSYSIRDACRPTKFHISNAKGVLMPWGKAVDILITNIMQEVSEFNERLLVRTDLIDKVYIVRVKGHCEEAVLHSEEFTFLNMGICPVLETTVRSLKLKNYGKFPLEFTVKAAYPLKVHPTVGLIKGSEASSLSVFWNPSGGYELRTQISLLTNIGTYEIIRYLFEIIILTLEFVPSVSLLSGSLAIHESKNIDVFFKPNMLGRFVNSLMIECKGINYKEVSIVGIGGQMKVEIFPPSPNLGRGVVIHLSKSATKLLATESLTQILSNEMLSEPVVENMDLWCLKMSHCHHYHSLIAKTIAKMFRKLRDFQILNKSENRDVTSHTSENSWNGKSPDNQEPQTPEETHRETVRPNNSNGETLWQYFSCLEKLNIPLELIKNICTNITSISKSHLGRANLSLREILNEFVEQMSIIQEHSATSKISVTEYAQNNHYTVSKEDINKVFDGLIIVTSKEAGRVVEDSIIEEVVTYPYVNIKDVDISEIFEPISPNLTVDIDIITERPPPFGKDLKSLNEEITNSRSKEKLTEAKAYIVFPSLNRKSRNAKLWGTFARRSQ
ncbi:hypothetical protein BJ742DRAFT_868198 [Cladochytrium replicatum]|nr:hypothetical protein BJ742DRAFT_868198 [Cladochytrium replicatum]